jgi:hypothetical protein
MKFLCNTEFFLSGARLYTQGAVYSDITQQIAEQMIALDKGKPLGALSFFTPVDDEAVKFVNAKKTGLPATGSDTAPPVTPIQPTKAELVAEAKNLGIKYAERMSVKELQEVIEAAKKAS